MARETTLAPSAPVLAPPYDKLSPGPGMSAGRVASNQRSRLCGAMIELAGERGYRAVTVRDLSRLAGVSTRTFYDHFRDKEDCAVTAIELAVQRTTEEISKSHRGQDDRAHRLELALPALMREIARRPQPARLVLIAPYAIGPPAQAQLTRTCALAERIIGRCVADAASDIKVSPLIAKGIVAGLASVIRTRLLAGRERELPRIGADLGQWISSYRGATSHVLETLDHRKAEATDGSELSSTAVPSESSSQMPGNDRTLILNAVAKLAAAEGYGQLTVSRIRVAAGVSRRSFDAEFSCVEECFLAAVEARSTGALEQAATETTTGRNWASDVCRSIAGLSRRIAHDPLLTRLVFIDLLVPGPAGLRSREAIVGTAAELFVDSAPESRRPNEIAAAASAGAVWGVIHHYVASGRTWDLPRIAPALSFLMLAPVIGAPAATIAIRREREPG